MGGEKNSSLTRVRPFFSRLMARDPSGEDWLSKLLCAMPASSKLGEYAESPGRIARVMPMAWSKREEMIGPPSAFLRWLLLHPEELEWQEGGGTKDLIKRAWREKLCCQSAEPNPSQQQAAIAEGLRCLEQMGARDGAWWVFEGQTHVDFYIETNRGLRVYVEGKRTEGLSRGTLWFRQRYQFVRNLEAAREHANRKPYACLLMSEVPIQIPKHLIASGLPHVDAAEQAELASGYIGNITWMDACVATGIDFMSLPDTVHELREQDVQ
jgi:hypothetical protein